MRLNKTQKYAINWLVSQDTEIKDIVKELKLQIACVQNYIDKHLKEQKASIQEHENTDVAKKMTSKDLMIRHTSNKSNNTVAIMTKEASEMNDSNKKKPSAKVRDTSHIFRMANETK